MTTANSRKSGTVKRRVPEVLLSRREAAERFGIHIRTIDYYLNTHKITKWKDGRNRVWVDPEEIEVLITPVAVVSPDARPQVGSTAH